MKKSFLVALLTIGLILVIITGCGSSPSSSLTPSERLWNAARNNRINEAKTLIQNGANVNFRGPSNTTPLHPASAFSDLELVQYLVEHGADINARNDIGNTPLIFAVTGGKLANAKYLIDMGANVNARLNDRAGNDAGKSALNFAYEQGDMEIYNYLIAHGAVDFEPRQIAQPTTQAPQTNVYVQPSAPAQTPAPAPARNPAPSAPTFQTGTYAWSNSGVNMTMSFNAGMVSAFLNRSGIWTGTYSVNGTQLVISVTSAISDYSSLQGMTYSYTITSSTSFSGSGETWVRTGY